MLSRNLLKIRLPQPAWKQFIRFKTTQPPSYFSEHLDQSPKPIFDNDQSAQGHSNFSYPSSSTQQQQQPYIPQPLNTTPPQSQLQSQSSSSSSSSSSKFNSFKDLSIVLSILALSYFAVDNYRTRIELETKIIEQSMNQMKSLAITQNNYNNQRRKRDLQLINERKNIQKREMKMVYHISMLRKQLIDAGLKPAEIDHAIEEFEKNVKMEYSLSNVSGTALWIVDDSPMKAYVPNIHDYDSKK